MRSCARGRICCTRRFLFFSVCIFSCLFLHLFLCLPFLRFQIGFFIQVCLKVNLLTLHDFFAARQKKLNFSKESSFLEYLCSIQGQNKGIEMSFLAHFSYEDVQLQQEVFFAVIHQFFHHLASFTQFKPSELQKMW